MKSEFANIIVVASMLAVAGCASADREWVRDGTPGSEADQALAECKYEAQAATVTIGANERPGSWGGAVSEGIASGVVRGIDQAELEKSCMEAKGFRR